MFNPNLTTSTAATTQPVDPVKKAVDALVKTKIDPKCAGQTRTNPALVGRSNQLVIGPSDSRLPFVDLTTRTNRSLHLYSAVFDLRLGEYVEYDMVEELMRSRAFVQLPDTAYSPAGIAAVETMLSALVYDSDPDRDETYRDGRLVLPDLMSDSAVLERQYSVMSKSRLAKTIPPDLTIRFVDFDYGGWLGSSSQVRVRHTPDAVHDLGHIRFELMPYEHGVRTMSDMLDVISAPSWQDFLIEITN